MEFCSITLRVKKAFLICYLLEYSALKDHSENVKVTEPKNIGQEILCCFIIGHVLYLVLFSMYPSLSWELRNKRNLKNCNFDPKASESC